MGLSISVAPVPLSYATGWHGGRQSAELPRLFNQSLPLTRRPSPARYLVASGALRPQNNYIRGGGGATKVAVPVVKRRPGVTQGYLHSALIAAAIATPAAEAMHASSPQHLGKQ